MAVLQTLQGLTPGLVFALEGNSITLGRHPECDVVLEAAAVSRQHARILVVDGKYYVEDLHSRNGTLLNGRPLVQREPLREHDQLGICDLVFIFHHGPPDLELPVARRFVETAEPAAMMIDDEDSDSNSTVMSKVEVSAGHSGLRLSVNTEAKLKALVEISQHLGKALALNQVLPKLLDSLFSIFIQADRGFVVLRDPATGRLVPKAVKYRRGDDREMIRISRTIVNGVMAAKEAVLSADAATDARFRLAESIVDFHIRSMMCAPLISSEGGAIGVIQIDTVDQRNRFTNQDLEVLASVACQAAFAVENAQLHETLLREQTLKRELSVAHEVLRGFLPAASPRIEQYEFFEFYEPANQLGGDYYDYIPLPNGRLAVVVADVSGKGIPASLLMARLSADARYCLASEPTPGEAVGRLNHVFCTAGWEDRFVTLVLAVLDPLRHEVTMVNAGHLPPLLRRGAGRIEPVVEVETHLPLGVEDQGVYVQHTLPLQPGNVLALYTDGITEAMNDDGQQYGIARLRTQLGCPATRIDRIGRRILEDVKQFVGLCPQSDDMCLVCLGRQEDGGGG
jgi:serine phosphatase RsbU (regulator of sigma subunit)/pSer/pThr/pTyr-binding forkhead associated (FHA) protein